MNVDGGDKPLKKSSGKTKVIWVGTGKQIQVPKGKAWHVKHAGGGSDFGGYLHFWQNGGDPGKPVTICGETGGAAHNGHYCDFYAYEFDWFEATNGGAMIVVEYSIA